MSKAEILLALLVPASVFLIGSCVDERIVYQRVRFDPLPVGAANFVGYSDQATKETVCGNCHVGQQSDWTTTAHADAWNTLQESGQAQAFCEGCHTVGQLGNALSEPGGYEATKDTRYYDVQCESCHGAGLTHVENPDIDENIPAAPMSVGADLSQGCGECHSGSHHPFVEEWEQSGHGQVIALPAGRAECNICHTAENVLLSWGVQDNYAEKVQALNDPSVHLPITCGVCHDPHARSHEGQLRFPIDAPSEEENLCMKCHHKRGNPDPSTFRGPHSPEGPLLLGYGGWWAPAMEFLGVDTIEASHGSGRNPRLCAGCHVTAYSVTDQLTGEQVFTTGHLFQAIPCLVDGAPTTGDCDVAQRSFRSCVSAQCHDSENIARGFYGLARGRIADLVQELDALLALVPPAEFSNTDNRYTTAEGARFNQELGENFRGSAIHNPILMEALLRASINQVRADYNLPGQTGVSLEQVLGIGR